MNKKYLVIKKSIKYQTQDKETRQVKVTRDKTRVKDKIQDNIQDKTEVWETEKRKNFEGLQVGDTLYIEEIQIPHKTLTVTALAVGSLYCLY